MWDKKRRNHIIRNLAITGNHLNKDYHIEVVLSSTKCYVAHKALDKK